MEQDTISRLDSAGIPVELKLALKEVLHEVEALSPSLPRVQQRRSHYRIERVVTEATDPAVDTHWWPVYVDLVAKAARELGATGQPVVDAIQRLLPLLWSRLGPYDPVSLQPITEDTVWGICQLSDTLSEPRKGFVATNAVSLAQAHFNPHAWFRAVHAGKAPVGFMMLADDADAPEYFLWRFMIADPYQSRGYGRQAIQRLAEYVRTRPGATELLVSCGEGEGSPKEFYLKQGFVPTGEVVGEETVLKLVL